MEYMSGGSLTEIISICKMTEPQIAAVCRDVLKGLEYLHKHRRIHRDIKSQPNCSHFSRPKLFKLFFGKKR